MKLKVYRNKRTNQCFLIIPKKKYNLKNVKFVEVNIKRKKW